MTVDTHLPRVAISRAQKDTAAVGIVKAHANENPLRDTETMITVDLLKSTDRPAGGATTMRMRMSAGDADARGGNATRIGTTIGGGTTICQRNHGASTRATREVITGVMLEVISTMPPVYTTANTDPKMTPTRCRSRITL
jgi:hypothetical protein